MGYARDSSTPITFPLKFNKVYSVTANSDYPFTEAGQGAQSISSITTTGFTWNDGVDNSYTGTAYYIAIGI